MFVRTPAQIGQLVKERRSDLGLTQAQLAGEMGVSRQWVVGLELGAERVELHLVLLAFERLGLMLDIIPASRSVADAADDPFGPTDLDALIDEVGRTDDVEMDLRSVATDRDDA